MAKKLKKKQRPMTVREWMDSTGGSVFVLQALDGDEERLHQIASADLDSMDDGLKEAQKLGEQMFAKYHEYICVHIAHLLEAKR